MSNKVVIGRSFRSWHLLAAANTKARRGHSPTVIHTWDVRALPAPGSLAAMRSLITALALTVATTVAPAAAYAAPTAIASCALSSLPSQAADTLDLIHSGGPFPYRQDGTVF